MEVKLLAACFCADKESTSFEFAIFWMFCGPSSPVFKINVSHKSMVTTSDAFQFYFE